MVTRNEIKSILYNSYKIIILAMFKINYVKNSMSIFLSTCKAANYDNIKQFSNDFMVVENLLIDSDLNLLLASFHLTTLNNYVSDYLIISSVFL